MRRAPVPASRVPAAAAEAEIAYEDDDATDVGVIEPESGGDTSSAASAAASNETPRLRAGDERERAERAASARACSLLARAGKKSVASVDDLCGGGGWASRSSRVAASRGR